MKRLSLVCIMLAVVSFAWATGDPLIEKSEVTVGNHTFVIEKVDFDKDGSWDEQYAYKFDLKGHLLSIEFDYDVDGIVDAMSILTYDNDGNFVGEAYDDSIRNLKFRTFAHLGLEEEASAEE